MLSDVQKWLESTNLVVSVLSKIMDRYVDSYLKNNYICR